MHDHQAARTISIRVFLALMVLTAVTVGVSFVNLGAFNLPVALLIACTKASLVLVYFMHLKGNFKLLWVAAASGFLFLLVLISLTLSDYFTRDW
ncbi:MAG: cytochrome C oxidase subunit IV family protein [Planctomycetota bacterium]